MLVSTLEMLRCPFCGTALDVVENEALVRTADRISAGVLGCQCCAFPVVAGIPVLIADDRTRDAMHALEAGRADEALLALLDSAVARLSARSLSVLRDLMAGTSQREIAERLGVSPSAVSQRVRSDGLAALVSAAETMGAIQ